jgi:hypothetical protein
LLHAIANDVARATVRKNVLLFIEAIDLPELRTARECATDPRLK